MPIPTYKISSSAASKSCYYFNSNNGSAVLHENNHLRRNPTRIESVKKIDDRPHRLLLMCTVKYGINRRALSYIMPSNNFRPQASSSGSPDPSSSSWKKWLMGILFTVILPVVGHKGGLLLGFKGKIDKAIETVEHVTEVVEEMAEKAEKIMEEVEEKLPGDSKMKEALDSFEDLAQKAIKEARKAEDLVHKVKVVEEEIEKVLINGGNGEGKK